MVRELSPHKRSAIMKTALELFVRNGIQHTSTSEISKEAGIAAGTLFLYFPTKQELIDEITLQIGRDQSTYVKQHLDPRSPTREFFYTIWSCSIHWFLNQPQAYLFQQQIRDTPLVSQSALEESNRFLDYFFDAIQKALSEGCISNEVVDLVGQFLYQDIVAVMSRTQLESDKKKINVLVDLGFEIFWKGITK